MVAPVTYQIWNPQAAVASSEGRRASASGEAASSHEQPKRTAAAGSSAVGHAKRIKKDVGDVSHEICRAYNAHKCSEPCPSGRRHALPVV